MEARRLEVAKFRQIALNPEPSVMSALAAKSVASGLKKRFSATATTGAQAFPSRRQSAGTVPGRSRRRQSSGMGSAATREDKARRASNGSLGETEDRKNSAAGIAADWGISTVAAIVIQRMYRCVPGCSPLLGAANIHCAVLATRAPGRG